MTDYRISAGEAQEDQFTAAIEKCTSQIPSSAYLGAALASMAVSAGFKIAKKDHMALFVRSVGCAFPHIGHLQQTREAAWIRRQHSDRCTFHCWVDVKRSCPCHGHRFLFEIFRPNISNGASDCR
jgi:hypothetical protein